MRSLVLTLARRQGVRGTGTKTGQEAYGTRSRRRRSRAEGEPHCQSIPHSVRMTHPIFIQGLLRRVFCAYPVTLGCFLEGVVDAWESLVEVRVTRGFLVCIGVPYFVVFGELNKHTLEYFGVELGDGVDVVVCFITIVIIEVGVIA